MIEKSEDSSYSWNYQRDYLNSLAEKESNKPIAKNRGRKKTKQEKQVYKREGKAADRYHRDNQNLIHKLKKKYFDL